MLYRRKLRFREVTSLGRDHTADGRNPTQAWLICRLQALGWIFQLRGPVWGPGGFSYLAGEVVGVQGSVWTGARSPSDQIKKTWTSSRGPRQPSARPCHLGQPWASASPGRCLGTRGGSAGGECLGSRAVPLHSNPEGLSPPAHVSPGSLPARGLSLAAPTVSAPTPLTQARILESPGCVLLGTERAQE